MSPIRARRWVPWLLLGILGVAATLRLWGVRWGLPDALHPDYSYHPDEAFHMAWARLLVQGQYMAQHFMYGGTLHYTVLNAFWRYASWLGTALDGVNPLAHALLVGRWCVVGFSLLTLLVVAATGRRLVDWPTGLLAAAFLALAPAHVFLAQNVRPDELGTLLTALSGLLGAQVLRGQASGDARRFLLGGLLAGVATGLRFPLAVFGIAPLAGLLLREGPAAIRQAATWRLLALQVLLAIGGYLLASPHSVLEPDWLRAGLGLQQQYQSGLFLDAIDGSTGLRAVWWLLLREALGTPLYALTVVGLPLALAHRRRETLLVILVALPYLVATTFVTWLVVRYTLPATPFLALLAAIGWRSAAQRAPKLAALVLAGVLGTSLAADVAFARLQGASNVREQLAAWLAREARAGDTIVVFRNYALEEFYSPSLPAGTSGIVVNLTDDVALAPLLAKPDVAFLVVPEPVYRSLDRLGQEHPRASTRRLGELLANDPAFKLTYTLKLPVPLAGVDFSDWFRSQDFFVINPGYRVYQRRR